MENYRANLESAAKKLAGLMPAEVPLVFLIGSLADECGLVHEGSDIDLAAATNEAKYFSKTSPVVWEPYARLRKDIPRSGGNPIDVLAEVDGRYNASIIYRNLNNEILERTRELKNKEISHSGFDFLVEYFVLGKKLRDSLGIFEETREDAKKYFDENRRRFAIEEFNATSLSWKRAEDQSKIRARYEREGRDYFVGSFNTPIEDLIGSAVYIRCCAENIPRPRNTWLTRYQLLLEGLGCDINSLNQLLGEGNPKLSYEDRVSKLKKMLVDTFNLADSEFEFKIGEVRQFRYMK